MAFKDEWIPQDDTMPADASVVNMIADEVIRIGEEGNGGSGSNGKSPYIGDNGNWYEWNDIQQGYVDTGVNANGEDGYTPRRGIDYWTDEDKAEIKSYVDEAILGGAW